MTHRVVSTNAPISIPTHVATCPICGAELVLELEEWEQLEDGLWRASEAGTHTDCITEPDIDADEWEDWHNAHWSMPYVDWLPVERRVWRWLDKHYRFIVEE